MNPVTGSGCAVARWAPVVTTLVILSLSLCAPVPVAAQTRSPNTVPIHKNILSDKADYHGPERDEPEPQNIREVLIGFFAPNDLPSTIGRNMWRGATLAVEHANAEGGYGGKPFRLVCRWADNPWGAGSREMTRLVYEDRVWAVIGSVDGASTHVAEQVATRARITLVSPLSGDPSLTHAAVPWMFRLPPDDASVAQSLAELAVRKMGFHRVILLSSTDHDGRAGAIEIVSALARYRVAPVLHLNFIPSQTDFSEQMDRISSTSPDAIFLWGLPDPSLRLLLALREKGINLPIFGPAVFSLPSFFEKAGNAAEGLITCRLTWDDDGARSEDFAREFETRFGERPADDAALGYDAAVILIEATRKGGLNRARIRDAVAGMSGFVGLSGEVTWDNGGGNVARPQPVRVHSGQPCVIEE